MSNFRELLFMENDEWVKTTVLIDDYRDKIRECVLNNDLPQRMAYYKLLDRAIERKAYIEASIMAGYRSSHKVYRLDASYDTLSDDYLTDQIAKNGYLTGFKF